MLTRYKIEDRLSAPLLDKIRKKYEEWFLFGTIDEMCERFNVDESYIRRLIYSHRKSDQTLIMFDNIIKLSYMFDIPYEEFIAYNAMIDYERELTKEESEEGKEMLKQYSLGKAWEDKVLDYYSKKGYFTYKIPTMNSGTVFDVIVVRKGAALMIECKHIDGDKLYYSGSGILKKRDEIDNFIEKTGNNLYIYVNSEKTGTWWTTWLKAKPIFEEKGYITKEDCFPCEVE